MHTNVSRYLWRPLVSTTIAAALLGYPQVAGAADVLCDTSFQDCRKPLLDLIAQEQLRIDVAFNLMESDVIADALISRFKARVAVRVLMDPRRNSVSPKNAAILQKLAAAGIPMRGKTAGGAMHWKFMLFKGLGTLEMGAANFSDYYLIPLTPYVNYTAEAVFITDDLAVVDSFKTRMDDAWMDTTQTVNYANISGSLAREYDTFSIDPALLFVPWENFARRAVPLYDAETVGIDVLMYKITEASHADGLIRAARRLLPGSVRLIVEPSWYRNPANVWHAYQVDRLYASGVKIRVRAHLGFMHQKTVLLKGQALSIFGSSNWSSESNKSQYEHNYFTKKSGLFTWLKANFSRKWNNSTGNAETTAFVPAPPGIPVYVAPANSSNGQLLTGLYLSWKPGLWAHRADIYFGTTPAPPVVAANVAVSPGGTKKYALPALEPGRTYYWKIVSKTMANKEAMGPVWSFTTQ